MEGYGWCVRLSIDLLVGSGAIVIHREFASSDGLSIVDKSTVALA